MDDKQINLPEGKMEVLKEKRFSAPWPMNFAG